MNNQGLDALAALAAAASHSPYPSISNGASHSNGGQKEEAQSDKKTSIADGAPTQAPTVNPPLPDMAAQQWQQAIANAASSISALSGPGGQNNLALLGMQQLNQATAAANPNILAIQQQLAMQQQLNYYQLLAHAATQQQRQFSSNHQVMNAAAVPGTAATTAQALSQVLGVHAVQTPFPNINGTS